MIIPEPLRGKVEWFDEVERGSNYDAIQGFRFDNVKSACDFYKKYRVSTKHIQRNYKLGGVYNEDLYYSHPELVSKYMEQTKPYNEWLFNYCFKDVI